MPGKDLNNSIIVSTSNNSAASLAARVDIVAWSSPRAGQANRILGCVGSATLDIDVCRVNHRQQSSWPPDKPGLSKQLNSLHLNPGRGRGFAAFSPSPHP